MRWELLPWLPLGFLGLAAGLAYALTRVRPQLARLRDSERMAVAVNASLMRVTEQLEARERQLRAVADNLPVLISYVDVNEVYRFANEAARDVLGADPPAMIGRSVIDVLGPATYASAKPHIDQALSGYPVTYSRTTELKGRVRHYRATYQPDYTPDGRVEGFHAMVQDVTAATEAEAALRAGEERLRTITDNVPVLIGYIDRDLVYRFNNRTYSTWYGRPIEQITGRPVEELIGPERIARSRGEIDRALAGETVTFEYHLGAPFPDRDVKAIFVPDRAPDGTVRGVYTVTQDVTAAKRIEAELERQARFDSLTGLPNRLLLQERLERAQARVQRDFSSLALLYLDLDRFKEVNDTHGHAAGDAVLREFGRRLDASVRRTDTVARMSGDEFVVLLEGLKVAGEAEVVAGKILAAMCEPIDIAGEAVVVGTSIGIALHSGAGVDTATLLARADAALYSAKSAGRNTYAFAPPATPSDASPALRSRTQSSPGPAAAHG